MLRFQIDNTKELVGDEKAIIEALREIQFVQRQYNEFLTVLKNRLRKYTGDESVMFYTEKEVVDKLNELGVVRILET